jgi:hypothetical protein
MQNHKRFQGKAPVKSEVKSAIIGAGSYEIDTITENMGI